MVTYHLLSGYKTSTHSLPSSSPFILTIKMKFFTNISRPFMLENYRCRMERSLKDWFFSLGLGFCIGWSLLRLGEDLCQYFSSLIFRYWHKSHGNELSSGQAHLLIAMGREGGALFPKLGIAVWSWIVNVLVVIIVWGVSLWNGKQLVLYVAYKNEGNSRWMNMFWFA